MRLPLAYATPILLALACTPAPPAERAPSPPDAATPSAASASQSASAASQAASAASLPAGHSTATTAAALDGLFRMPDTEAIVLKVGASEVPRKALVAELQQLRVELAATGGAPRLSRKEVLKSAVDRLTERTLRAELAKKLGVTANPADVRLWKEKLKVRMEANPAFAGFLRRAGKTDAQIHEDAQNAVIAKGIAKAIQARAKDRIDEKAKAYYRDHPREFLETEARKIWRIYVKAPAGQVQRDRDIARARAEGIVRNCQANPKRFEDIAKSSSEGGNAHIGGFIGWAERGRFPKDLDNKIWKSKPGTVLDLYEDASGFYVYKVGAARKERMPPFSEVRDRIMDRVLRPVVQAAIDEETKKLRDELGVTVLIPELEAAPAAEPRP